MAEPNSTPPVVHLAFFARLETNGTYTLCLDAAESTELPVEIGGGYTTPAEIIAALVAALTAPAVAEDRIAAVEDYAPALNAAIDSTNEMGEAMQGLNDRIRELEAWRTELERIEGGGFRPPTRPAIPRVGAGARRSLTAPPSLRRPLATEDDEPYREGEPEVLPVRQPPAGRAPNRSVVGPSSLDEPRPNFDRGDFKPHQPVGRVGRGPNSVG